MKELEEIDLKNQEKKYKQNIRYRKIRKASIFLSILMILVFVILNLLKDKDNQTYNLDIYSKLNGNGNLETIENISFNSRKEESFKKVIPELEENIENIEIRIAVKNKNKTSKEDQIEKLLKAEETTKEEYDKLSSKEKAEKLVYYVGYVDKKENLEDSNIKDKIVFKTNKELLKENEVYEEAKKENNEKSENKEEEDGKKKEKELEETKEKKSSRKVIIYIPINKELEQTRKVSLAYTIKNAAKKYNDIAELNYNIIDRKDNNELKKLVLEMEFPSEGLQKEDTSIWFFGRYDGKSYLAGNKVHLNISKEISSDELSLAVLFDRTKLDKDVTVINEDRKEKATKYYTTKADEYKKDIDSIILDDAKMKKADIVIILAATVITILILLKLFFNIIKEKQKRREIESVIKSFKYYDNPPEEFKFNFTKMSPLVETSGTNLFKSIFIKLIYKGLILPEKEKKLFLKVNTKTITKLANKISGIKTKKEISDDFDIEYIFTLDDEDYKRQDEIGYILKEDEYVYNFLKQISKDNKFTLSDLTEALEGNFKTILEKDLKKLVYLEKEKLFESGYFDKDTNKRELNVSRHNAFNILIFLLFIILSVIFYNNFRFPMYLSFYAFLITIVNSYKYKVDLKGINEKGLEAEAQIIGFRNFLRDSSLLDLKVENEKDVNLIRQYLMYATYFELEDKFLQKTKPYYDVPYRKVFKDKEEEDEEMVFKYKDTRYLLKRMDESIMVSTTYYNTGFSPDGPMGLFETEKKKRNIKLKK